MSEVMFTAADVRRAERAAWDRCVREVEAHVSMHYFMLAEMAHFNELRDRRYPLPTRPRTIPLSSGELACAGGKSDGEWYVRLDCTSVLTAADIAALAELVAKPTEPCE